MIDESLRLSLARLNELEGGLRASARAGAPRAVGSDKRGAVTIVLEGDRFLIEIADDWERRVGASGIAASAGEALSDATTARFDGGGASLETTEIAELTLPNPHADANVVQRFVDENRAADEAVFSDALDLLVERARSAARKRINHRGPAELATVLLAPDGSVNQIAFDETAVQHREGRDLASDVMAAVSIGQQALRVPLLAQSE
ncbi:hypothetical protein [Salinibacterium sp. PAMC 21357]|uniref:hypothetical protein n=1 Tax=Salinibacterium sp. PAMC 21357 TaxID=1112215 RepID=UPI000289B159|nr:hypothetical protein [Salinibacterium sp. PAMC 21357]